MPFPRRASDGDAPASVGRAPVFTPERCRQGIALRFLSLCRSDKSICDPPGARPPPAFTFAQISCGGIRAQARRGAQSPPPPYPAARSRTMKNPSIPPRSAQ